MNRFLLSCAVAAPLLASWGAEVSVDFSREVGPVKPVNAVGAPPMTSPVRHFLFHYLKEAGIP